MQEKRLTTFDFDGTMTSRDTFLAILRYGFGERRFWTGLLRYSPWLVLMKMHLYSNYRAKERVFTHFFRGMSEADFDTLCRRFAADNRQLMRQGAVDAMAKALERGDEVAVVSASIDTWVSRFLDPRVRVLATKAETTDGLLTGKFASANCYGEEKVNRLRQAYGTLADYHITAYGDSRGDREMLSLADEAHYKPFR